MNKTGICSFLLAGALGLSVAMAATVGTELSAPTGPARATIDLGTHEGAAIVAGQWRYSDTKIVEIDFRGPGADGQPTGKPVKTYDVTPHAGSASFDDSAWEVIDATTLQQRRSTGRICFNWYRINLTVPRMIKGFDPTGSTIVFETALDDYAEVWVDGEISREIGQRGGSVVNGWNAPNRLVVGRDVTPGQKIQLAVFGMNGPISNPPTNFIWMRYARLEFFDGERGPRAVPPKEVNVEITRNDAALDAIVPANPKVYKLAEGFKFTEGPVWVRDGTYLLFSDPNSNKIYKYTRDGTLSVFRDNSGYTGTDIAEYGQPGSNGLSIDPQGRLTINQHGNRRVIRLEKDGSETVLADRYDGDRLNSPNDLTYRSDGTLFFTDPPFGLPKFFEDPRQELWISGVYSLRDGVLKLVSTDFGGPNGLALSPDEKYLYIGNWDEKHKIVKRYEVAADGSLSNGQLFFDMTSAPGEDAIDGVKTDTCMCRVPEVSGSCRRPASISARSCCRSMRTTSRGATTMAKRSTSPPARRFTRCGSTSRACVLSTAGRMPCLRIIRHPNES
jgi:gluconolactonase